MSTIDASFSASGEPIENNTDIAKCPACGAKMVFSPEKQQLECPYCGCTKEVDFTKTSSEIAFEEMLKQRNDEWGGETHVFRCNNCGAKEVIDSTEIAKQCPFCGTTNVAKVDELSGMRPNAVVPFSISAETATGNVVAWAKKKFFAPTAFKKSVKPENVRGTYMPAFTFDTNTFTTYTGRLGKYYTRTVRSGKTVRTVRELRYFNIAGEFCMDFDDVLIQAGKRISQKEVDKIAPFGTGESKVYSSEFLHGFSAQSNEKSGEECWEEARERIFAEIQRRILAKYNYDVVDSFVPRTSCADVTFKYVLLPIYVGHCNWKTKLYNFFVNGENGKVTGKVPTSPWKVALVVLLGLAVVGGIILGVNLLGS